MRLIKMKFEHVRRTKRYKCRAGFKTLLRKLEVLLEPRM